MSLGGEGVVAGQPRETKGVVTVVAGGRIICA